MRRLPDVLTTGEAGRLLKVTTNTMAKWVDSGRIRGYKHPDSPTRRIGKQDLLKFVVKNNIPLERLQNELFLTTAKCAECCFVALNIVTKWIDTGKLPAFNLGTNRRLVFYRDLVKFMRKYKIPPTRVKKHAPKE